MTAECCFIKADEDWVEPRLWCVPILVPAAMPTQKVFRAGANKVRVPLSHLGRAWCNVTKTVFEHRPFQSNHQ
ncbi:hypothetical protein Baya_2063 [Bagarius yarrelli]|uniref:Uncharacterized protein n=1 Tax=Bagarius yarrelli TaxID=175774 RepID=A0A556TMW1_BAGYA|nr:hypothetical protein Baya_2063 [Bagarius yarrelli]